VTRGDDLVPRWLAIVVALLAAGTTSTAFAQEEEFPPGAENTEGIYTVPVDTPKDADQLCNAFQTSTTAYPGEDSVTFDVVDDTDSDVICVRTVEATDATEGIPSDDGSADVAARLRLVVLPGMRMNGGRK
jgi:hypothetical protein